MEVEPLNFEIGHNVCKIELNTIIFVLVKKKLQYNYLINLVDTDCLLTFSIAFSIGFAKRVGFYSLI